MARTNPTNPYTRDKNHTSKDVQMPISKARVIDANGMPEEDGFHVVRIRVYGEQSNYHAPVLTPMPGAVWVPPIGTDVAVLFTQEGKPWVIGSWYALDRHEDGDVQIPDYEPGDMRLGNQSDSHITIKSGGGIETSEPLGTTDVSDSGTTVVSGTEDINFNSNLSVTDDGDGSVTVDASGSSDSDAVETVTSSYTASDGDTVLADASGGDITITLPTPSKGSNVYLKKISDANTVSVDASGDIEGKTSFSMTAYRDAVSLVADGTDWWII